MENKNRKENCIMTILEFSALITLLFASFGIGYKLGKNAK